MRTPSRLTRLAAPLAIGVAWAVSLALPAIAVQGGPTWTGLELLSQGWEGASRGVFSWFANPLFLVALLAAALRRLLIAAVVSAAAAILAATSFWTEETLRQRMEGVPELTFGTGFYLWLIASLALCVYAWAALYLERRSRKRSFPSAADER